MPDPERRDPGAGRRFLLPSHQDTQSASPLRKGVRGTSVQGASLSFLTKAVSTGTTRARGAIDAGGTAGVSGRLGIEVTTAGGVWLIEGKVSSLPLALHSHCTAWNQSDPYRTIEWLEANGGLHGIPNQDINDPLRHYFAWFAQPIGLLQPVGIRP